MLFSHIQNFLRYLFIFSCYTIISSQDVAKLPYCNDDMKHTDMILVSTLDGFVTALNPSGEFIWQIETGPGPLLQSNIHNLELTNNGQWLRIIPSLSGSLYKFDGVTIDPIPLSADSLLMSSFRYSDDLVIAGGREVRTYGIQLHSGKLIYECSLQGCKNTTEYSDDTDNIMIIERKTHTVHAVAPRTGTERWNFSVGQHDVKIPYVACIDLNLEVTSLNLTAVLPEGLLIATKSNVFNEILWKYKFQAPIAAVWKWNGRELIPVNLFSTTVAIVNQESRLPCIYLGMHDKQLYIHESLNMQNMLKLNQDINDKHSVIESKSLTQIPWKPVSAASMSQNAVDDDSTALSVLYASEYVNGNGYYLYAEEKSICQNNVSDTIPFIHNDSESITDWWKHIIFITFATVVISNFIMYYKKMFGVSSNNSSNSPVLQHNLKHENSSINPPPGSDDKTFVSKYVSEFDQIRCLGKGGFGKVFQAKKKFDKNDYAVKIITLPTKQNARERMMREVITLAQLDHPNIVRYFNAWLESPPHGWPQQYDKQWLSDSSMSFFDKSTSACPEIEKNSSLAIDVEPHLTTLDTVSERKQPLQDDSASIVFKRGSTTPALRSNAIDFECETNRYSNADTSSIVFKADSTISTALQSDSISFDNNVHNLHSNLFVQHPTPAYLFIQMQLCRPESLKDWLNKNPQRTLLNSLDIFDQIVKAVEYIHLRKLIHRDLKPSNILFSLDGQIKVGDFGLVTCTNDYDDEPKGTLNNLYTHETYTRAVGTHLYMSPEQLEGQQYDHKVDIYSLGIIFFELLVSFDTEMERARVLTDLRKNVYPTDFTSKFPGECELLKSMLSSNPEFRPTAKEILQKLLPQSMTDEVLPNVISS